MAVQALLDGGADPSLPDVDGLTATLAAALFGAQQATAQSNTNSHRVKPRQNYTLPCRASGVYGHEWTALELLVLLAATVGTGHVETCGILLRWQLNEAQAPAPPLPGESSSDDDDDEFSSALVANAKAKAASKRDVDAEVGGAEAEAAAPPDDSVRSAVVQGSEPGQWWAAAALR